MFAVGPHERQTASGYRRQAEEIRLLSEEQRGLSLHKFAISWRRCLKNCQSLLEWAGLPRIPGCEGSVLSFAQNLIGQGKPRERGAGLDPARRQPRWTQGCPAERPRPGSTMHCGPRHSERRVPAWQVRPGPSHSSFLPSRGRSNFTWPLPSVPASRHGSGHLQTYPRAGIKPLSWGQEQGVVGGKELWRGGIAGT